jgi:hypothetical protein
MQRGKIQRVGKFPRKLSSQNTDAAETKKQQFDPAESNYGRRD